MGVSIERILLCTIVVLSCLYVWRASAVGPKQATIKKVYHHRAATNHNVELGTCAIICEGNVSKQDIVETVVSKGDTEEVIFMMPTMLAHSAECQKMVQTINSMSNNAGYDLYIEHIEKPDKKVALHFKYPKNNCIVSLKGFDSIQREKGFLFNVYNRTMLEKLKRRQKPILRTAVLQPPRRIFLDPGHGGDDPGAVSASGMAEKDICLDITLKVRKILEREGYTVSVSRDNDIQVSLDMRTHKAQVTGAELLVSIHANASENKDACGIELFFFRS